MGWNIKELGQEILQEFAEHNTTLQDQVDDRMYRRTCAHREVAAASYRVNKSAINIRRGIRRRAKKAAERKCKGCKISIHQLRPQAVYCSERCGKAARARRTYHRKKEQK